MSKSLFGKILKVPPGVGYMALSTLWFAFMNISVKKVSNMPTMEVVFFRCFVAGTICFITLYRIKENWIGSNRVLLLARGIVGTLSLYLYFITVSHIPLASAVTIQYMSPLFTTLGAVLFMSEKVPALRWLGLCISFLGVLLLKGFDHRISWGYLSIGIISAIGSAGAYNLIRVMRGKEHHLVVVFHFFLVGSILGGLLMIPVFVWPSYTELLFLVLTGVFTYLGQVSMTKALQMGKVDIVTTVNYTGIIYALVLGSLLFKETFTWHAITGMLLVIGGVLMNILIANRKVKIISKRG